MANENERSRGCLFCNSGPMAECSKVCNSMGMRPGCSRLTDPIQCDWCDEGPFELCKLVWGNRPPCRKTKATS